MDGRVFDAVTRSIATTTSRRGLIGLVGAALVGLAGNPQHAEARTAKVELCHHDARSGTWTFLQVSFRAVAGHQRHGDAIDVDLTTDSRHCGACGNACETDETCEAGACTAPATCADINDDCELDSDCCPEPGSVVCGEIAIVGQKVCCIVMGNSCGGFGSPCCSSPLPDGTHTGVHCGDGDICGGVNAPCHTTSGGYDCVSGICIPDTTNPPFGFCA